MYNGYNTCNIRCVGFFSHTKQFSLTSAVCATIYLSYDTVYLERVSDPRDLELRAARLPPMCNVSHNPDYHLGSDQPATSKRFP